MEGFIEYFLTEQQKTLKSLAHRIAEERIYRSAPSLMKKNNFPKNPEGTGR